ncbi:CD209 antigen-like protein C isoform X2 [Clavelina lepadiformis]|uniref:CD209 antigen-like protein C isoform X2 n=1 Tax=Clavelina lepadiformis TaxID=159417 RepID=UPI0040431F4F
MFIVLIVTISSILSIQAQQEMLTCSRTSNTFQIPALSSVTTPSVTQPGVQGKRGPVGQKGAKGEPGIPDNEELTRLQDLRRMVENVEAVTQRNKNETVSLRRELLASLDTNSDWVTIFNGYQYRKTMDEGNWTQTRDACQALGGDLAWRGIQTLNIRKKLISELSLYYAWIGLTDTSEEGVWRCLDGSLASLDGTLWDRNEPNNSGGQENCAGLRENGFSNDLNCGSWSHVGLCEKKV